MTIILQATMVDGTVIADRAPDPATLAALVREYEADTECRRLDWRIERPARGRQPKGE